MPPPPDVPPRAAERPLSKINTPIPLHYQLKQALLSYIEQDGLRPGDRLPTEAALGSHYGVSRTTVRHALDQLTSDGYIERRQGLGTFVASPTISQLPRLTSFSETMERQGYTPSRRVIARHEREATLEVAADLLLTPGAATCLFVHRLLLADEKPVGLSETWLPVAALGIASAHISLIRLQKESLYKILQNPPIGIALHHGVETIRAESLSAEQAGLLQASAEEPVLTIRRVSFDPQNVPVESTRLVFLGRTYHYRVDLASPSSSEP